MGKNNRARRQEKLRKKRTQKNKGQANLLRPMELEELSDLCGSLAVLLEAGSMPPPHDLQALQSWRSHSKLGPLHSIGLSFFRYLYFDQPPNIAPAQLQPFRAAMYKAGFDWLYDILEYYSWLQAPALSQEPVAAIQTRLAEQQPRKENALLFLILHCLGEAPANLSLNKIISLWLNDSGLRQQLVSDLTKFLQIKRPKVTLKAASNLEAVLAKIDWSAHPVKQRELAMLLQFWGKQHGLLEKVEDWQSLPNIHGLFSSATEPDTTSKLSFNNDQTLNSYYKIEQRIDEKQLTFAERLQYHLLKCRMLSLWLDESISSQRIFLQQLGQVFMLCCTGVPPENKSLARKCLGTTVEWLAQITQTGRLQELPASLLHHPQRLMPEDYRLALLVFINNNKRPRKPEELRQIDAALFAHAVDECDDTETLLDCFYWPLSHGNRKTLASFLCKHLLVSMCSLNASFLWSELQSSMFDSQREPIKSVMIGKPCEIEWQFYCALATVHLPPDSSRWIKPETVAPLLRMASAHLRLSSSEFAVDLYQQLFVRLCDIGMEKPMLSEMGTLMDLLSKFDQKRCLAAFEKLLLQLQQQDDRLDPKYQEFYLLCQRQKKLVKLLPVIRKESSKHPKNLDIFGDL